VSPRKDPHAVALGRKGGKVRSEAKTLANRENGKKGGRPRLAPLLPRPGFPKYNPPKEKSDA